VSGAVILASSDVGPLPEWLDQHTDVLLVPTAANGLPDRHAMVEPIRQVLDHSGARWYELDLADSSPEVVANAVGRADVTLVGGGNPYLLLDEARRTGFDTALHELAARGGTYCGISAGAMLVAPSLEPLRQFAPFPAPPGGADLTGVGLFDLLVLPHTDRDGRRAKHEATLALYGRSHRLVALNDGECVIVDDRGWRIQTRSGLVVRPAVPSDAEVIVALFVASGRTGWAAFLAPEQIDQITLEPTTWADRIEAGEPENLVVASDDDGLAGFMWVRPAEDGDLTDPTGEVATFYTHPRVWGTGVGRRLMAYGLDRLRSMGYHEAVLWSEQRNERPLRIYAEGGWVLDGTSRVRDFHGFPITELRHRYAL
jgi:peptidase E/GNAT superfamily N-acetyltransferase